MKCLKTHSLVSKLLLLSVIICTLFIWGNSMMPASTSSAQSMQVLSFTEPILELLHIPLSIGHVLIRKAAHMSEFCLLGIFWSALLLYAHPLRLQSLVNVFLLCLLTALIDETIQLFTPGRGSLVPDVWIDCAGSIIGILLFVIIFCLKNHCR